MDESDGRTNYSDPSIIIMKHEPEFSLHLTSSLVWWRSGFFLDIYHQSWLDARHTMRNISSDWLSYIKFQDPEKMRKWWVRWKVLSINHSSLDVFNDGEDHGFVLHHDSRASWLVTLIDKSCLQSTPWYSSSSSSCQPLSLSRDTI